MYQEVKPREIWVNEYDNGFKYGIYKYGIYASIEAAKSHAGNGLIRQVKFIEVID
jgi:hypothetical protein